MRHELKPEHREHLERIGIPVAPAVLDIPDHEYNEHYENWRRTLPHAGHAVWHQKALANHAWKQHVRQEAGNAVAADRWHRVHAQHFPVRDSWIKRLLKLVGLAAILFIVTPAHAQFSHINYVNFQQAGSNVSGGFFTYPFNLNCSTNLTCSASGNTLTITAAGGAGTGCIPPGTTLNAILTDLTGGACGAATKWTASTTTMTGIATAILDMSAAARLRLPQITAPTNEGDAAFNTTSHLPVWGFNGASTTTIPKTLTNVSHKWANSYDQTTGTLTQTQPACTDLSDSAGGCTMSTTAGGDLSGTLPSPAVAKVNGNTPGNTCTNQFTRSIDSSARGSCATVANADMANTATTVNGQTCTLGSSCTIPLSATNAQTATYQVLAADFSNYKTIIVASGTFTITLVASGSQPADGQYIKIINYGSGVVTVARSGQNINGAAGNYTLSAGSATAPTSTFIQSNGTNYFASIDEGTVGTVTSVGTSAPLGGGAITGSGTITCTTCATTTNGGALSGTSPVAVSVAGAISCTTCATTTNGGALSGTSPVTVSVAGAIGCATCTVTIANGTSAMGTGAISSATCASVVTTSATGTATTDNIMADFNADPHAVTGYVPSTSGMLTIIKYPTANNVNFLVCNNTSGSITPGAITLNWRVVR